MTASLASTLSNLTLNDQNLTGAAFDARITAEEDGTYRDANQRPRKRTRQSPEDIKSELEAEFLTPSARFGGEWLGRLQRFVYHHLPHLGSTQLSNASLLFEEYN